MTIIQFAEKRLNEEIHENDLGAYNEGLLAYWSAYLDGARAQREEDIREGFEPNGNQLCLFDMEGV